MLPAFVLVVLGLRTPNPTAVGMEGLAARSPEGIVRVTRHPLLIGIGLWALVHLVANGDVASFLFFGALAVTALAGSRLGDGPSVLPPMLFFSAAIRTFLASRLFRAERPGGGP